MQNIHFLMYCFDMWIQIFFFAFPFLLFVLSNHESAHIANEIDALDELLINSDIKFSLQLFYILSVAEMLKFVRIEPNFK